MKEALVFFVFTVLLSAIMGWAFIATTYCLTCESFKSFDNAETKFVFPGVCYTRINGGEWEDRSW